MPRSSSLLIVILTCSTAGAQEPPARPNAPHPPDLGFAPVVFAW